MVDGEMRFRSRDLVLTISGGIGTPTLRRGFAAAKVVTPNNFIVC